MVAIGGLTDALGMTDHKGALEAKKASDETARESHKITQQTLELSKDKLDDWDDAFGQTAQDLGDYFNNELDGENTLVQKLQGQNVANQTATEQNSKNLAVSGRGGGRYEDYINARGEQTHQSKLASLRANEKKDVIKEQLGWVGLGLGQGTAWLAGVNNATGNASNSLIQHAGMQNDYAQTVTNNNGAMMRQLTQTAGGG